jgi:hypothetical protein
MVLPFASQINNGSIAPAGDDTFKAEVIFCVQGASSPMLSNIYLTAIEERYGRWSMRPREPSINAAARRARDRKEGKTAF